MRPLMMRQNKFCCTMVGNVLCIQRIKVSTIFIESVAHGLQYLIKFMNSFKEHSLNMWCLFVIMGVFWGLLSFRLKLVLLKQMAYFWSLASSLPSDSTWYCSNKSLTSGPATDHLVRADDLQSHQLHPLYPWWQHWLAHWRGQLSLCWELSISFVHNIVAFLKLPTQLWTFFSQCPHIR